MINYKKISLYTLFIISMFYIIFSINLYKDKYIQENRTIIGKVTYIRKQEDKTIFDII